MATHPKCYARTLDDCAGEITSEHPISQDILKSVWNPDGGKFAVVKGLSFQKVGEQQRLPIKGLGSNILCKSHNERLSDFDTEAGSFFRAIDALYQAKPVDPSQIILIDGDRLERWMLKALCGGLYSGTFRVGANQTMKDICPPTEWLEMIYRQREFPSGLGMYVFPSNEDIDSDPTIIKVAPLVAVNDDDIGVLGVRFWLFGFEFVLLMAELAPQAAFDRTHYRPAGFHAIGSDVSIAFRWAGGEKSEPYIIMRVPEASIQ